MLFNKSIIVLQVGFQKIALPELWKTPVSIIIISKYYLKGMNVFQMFGRLFSKNKNGLIQFDYFCQFMYKNKN